jgi:hypothetical protein
MTDLTAGEIAQMLPDRCRGVINAIADRPNEPPAAREARAQDALRQIEAYDPKTPLEIMLAGLAVLFQSLTLDAVHDANRASLPAEARALRQQATALGRMQFSYVKELQRSRVLAAQARKDAAAEKVVTPRRTEKTEAQETANSVSQAQAAPARDAPPKPVVPPVSPAPVAVAAPHPTANGAAPPKPVVPPVSPAPVAFAAPHPTANGAAPPKPVVPAVSPAPVAVAAPHPTANGAAPPKPVVPPVSPSPTAVAAPRPTANGAARARDGESPMHAAAGTARDPSDRVISAPTVPVWTLGRASD